MGEPPPNDDEAGAELPPPARMDARTKLDVIYREVLGEVSDLVVRVEKAAGKVLKAETLNASVSAAVQQAHEEAGQQLRTDINNANGKLVASLKEQVQQAKAAAVATRQATQRMVVIAACAGAAAGVLSGLLGAYFLVASGALGRLVGG